jgi:hypothetical protein
MSARNRLLASLAIAAALLLGGYFYLQGRDYVYRFSEAQIQDALAARLPLEKTYLFVFHVVLDHPRVTLNEGSDRVNLGIDVALSFGLGSESKSLHGSVEASAGLRYDRATAQFFLTDPVVERVALEGIPEARAEKVSAVLTQAVAEYYATRPVYALRPSTAKLMAARLLMKSARVENRELVVVLGVD